MDGVIYKLMLGLTWLISLFPPSLLRLIGGAFGNVFFYIDRRHRVIARKNLRFAYGGELSEAEVRRLVRRCYRHLGRVAFDMLWLLHVSPERLKRRVVIHGAGHASAAIARGRGVILLNPHFGNWELNSFMSRVLCGPTMAVARPLDFEPLDRLITLMRTKWGNEVTPKQGSMRAILRKLRSGGAVGILSDQNVDWYDGVFVPFFGRRACTNKGPALLWTATDCAVLTFYNYLEAGQYHVVVGEPLEFETCPDKTKTIEAVSRKMNAAVEAVVRRHPEQWMWLHHRWKTRPYHLWPKGKREQYGPNVAPSGK